MSYRISEKKLDVARKQIGICIEKRRLELVISIDELALMTKLGSNTIRRVESGSFWIGTKQLIIICAVLNIDLLSVFNLI